MGAAVLLGRVTDDQQRDREQLARTLGQFDITVLPADDYPEGGDRFRERFLADLKVLARASAPLFVQMLGPYPSRRPPEIPAGYASFQIEEARKAGLRTLLWRRNDVDPSGVDDPHHAALLDGAAAMTLEALKSEIRRLCAPVKAEPPATESFVFVNSDKSDLSIARDLQTALRKRNFGVALVFVFGEAEPSWLRRQLLHYQKLKPDRRKPPRIVRIFQGPPVPKADPGIFLPEALEVASVDDLINHLLG
jgi:hypothetical protein